jgi:hypothetical protein
MTASPTPRGADAPDLSIPNSQPPLPKRTSGNGTNGLNGNSHCSAQPSSWRAGAMVRNQTSSILDTTASLALADRLVAEINALDGVETATEWAQQNIAEKNRLLPGDAHRVEDTFRARLEKVSVGSIDAVPQRSAARSPRTKGVDKSALTLLEPRWVRDREHLRSVAQKACLVCGRKPSDPHHLRFAQTRGMGQKVSDEFIVPLCRGHHRELHRSGDEVAWWSRQGIDPAPAARTLWLESHPLPGINSSDAAASDDNCQPPNLAGGHPPRSSEHPLTKP